MYQGKKKLYDYAKEKKINFKKIVGNLSFHKVQKRIKNFLDIFTTAKNKLNLKYLTSEEVEQIEPEVKCYSASF